MDIVRYHVALGQRDAAGCGTGGLDAGTADVEPATVMRRQACGAVTGGEHAAAAQCDTTASAFRARRRRALSFSTQVDLAQRHDAAAVAGQEGMAGRRAGHRRIGGVVITGDRGLVVAVGDDLLGQHRIRGEECGAHGERECVTTWVDETHGDTPGLCPSDPRE
jgi:hypothetical protein